MEANGTIKKPSTKKMRLSLGLARVSPTGTQATLNEQNVEEEVNGDTESEKKPTETIDSGQTKLEETVENESEITTEINDKPPSTRGRKRKAEITKDDQIVEPKENTDTEKDNEENKMLEENTDKSVIKDEVENSDTKLDAPLSPKIPRTSARRRSKPPISFKKTKVKKVNTEDKKVSDNVTNMSGESDSGKLQDENLDHETDETQPVIKDELNDSVTNETKEDITEVTSSMDSDKDITKDEKLVHDSISKIKSEDVSFEISSSANNITSTPRTSQKSVRANRNNSPAAVLMKKAKVVPDLTNPIYLKPFQYGWKRELVYRAISDSNMKRHGDVYYYTPAGKKVRSMREVAENLRHKELNLDDFTFFKEPLGLDDIEKEIIRDARIKGTSTPVGGSTSVTKKKTKSKKIMKSSSDIGSDTPVASNTKVTKTPKTMSPQIKVKVPGRLGHGGRINSPKSERKRNTDSADMEIGLLPPGWDGNQKKASKQSKLSEGFGPAEQCSMNCPRIMGTIPTTQCQHCLCLFHPECVVVAPNAPLKQSVFCQNCYQSGDSKTTQDNMPDSNSAVCLPPLTPINSIKSHAPVLSQPPKLQRIPRQDKMFAPSSMSHRSLTAPQPKHIKNTENVKMPRGGRLETVPRFVKVSDQRLGGNVTPTDSSKNLVGSVTTWLPPNSTLQMAPSNDSFNSTAGERSPPPVSQAIIEGKNYIVVRKHNILSIHPNEQASTAPILDKSLPLSETNFEAHGNVTSFLDKIPATASLGPSLTDNLISSQSNIASQSKITRSLTESSIMSSDTNIQNMNNEHPMELTTSDSLVPSLPDPITLPPIPDKILNGDADRDPTSVNIITESQTPAEKPPVKSKRILQKQPTSAPVVQPDQNEKMKFAQYFFTNLSIGYDALLQVFQYLKVQELLRAGMVCRMWRDLASKPSLWRTVRMKNSQVCDWDGLVASLNRYGTHTLDLRKMLIPGNGDEMWTQFSSAISKATSLTRIYLCRCPATVVEELARTNPYLELINAVTIKCEVINPAPFENLKNLQELRLKSQNGISFKEDMTALKNLINLKHLSLVSIKVLGLQGVEVISALENLESLELGECTDFTDNFGTTVLSGLKKLEKLRLEKGPTSSTCTYDILATISKLPKVEQLELVNFDVKAGFDQAIAACTNVKRFLIIPTYISQSATTNHMVLNGVVQLNNTLSHFVWGVTLELLRVTELFVDQCDKNPKKEGSPKKDKKCLNAESIPVLKPVPFMMSGREDAVLNEDSSAKDNPQVEILPLANLQKLLCEKLPKTRVKILKIPFHATWRQSIHDSIQ